MSKIGSPVGPMSPAEIGRLLCLATETAVDVGYIDEDRYLWSGNASPLQLPEFARKLLDRYRPEENHQLASGPQLKQLLEDNYSVQLEYRDDRFQYRAVPFPHIALRYRQSFGSSLTANLERKIQRSYSDYLQQNQSVRSYKDESASPSVITTYIGAGVFNPPIDEACIANVEVRIDGKSYEPKIRGTNTPAGWYPGQQGLAFSSSYRHTLAVIESSPLPFGHIVFIGSVVDRPGDNLWTYDCLRREVSYRTLRFDEPRNIDVGGVDLSVCIRSEPLIGALSRRTSETLALELVGLYFPDSLLEGRSHLVQICLTRSGELATQPIDDTFYWLTLSGDAIELIDAATLGSRPMTKPDPGQSVEFENPAKLTVRRASVGGQVGLIVSPRTNFGYLQIATESPETFTPHFPWLKTCGRVTTRRNWLPGLVTREIGENLRGTQISMTRNAREFTFCQHAGARKSFIQKQGRWQGIENGVDIDLAPGDSLLLGPMWLRAVQNDQANFRR
ncbi:MAG: hypothetical protein O7E57_05510 [Gammaproteobacteria bacterium]|nr:hypothetical protein [Gammaproteobacteria bacterium]